MKAKIIVLSILILLALVVVGLCLYDIFVLEKTDVGNIIRGILLLAAIVLSIVRTLTRPSSASPADYRNSYRQFIGDAFEKDKGRELLFMTAIHKYQQNRYDRTLSLLARLEPTCKNDTERFAVLFFRALCLDEMEAYQPASACYEELLTIRDDSTIASNLGICYQRLGQNDRSLNAYLRAIDMNPENAYPYNNIAQLLLREEDFEGTLRYADMALARTANLYQAWSAKAIAHAMLGQAESYRSALRRATDEGADASAIRDYLLNAGVDQSVL